MNLSFRTFREKLKRAELLRNSATTVGIRVSGIALTYVFSLIVTNRLGPAAFGDYTFLTLLVNILSLLAAAGLDAFGVRYLAARSAEGEWARLRAFDRTALRVQLSAALGLAAAIFLSIGAGVWRELDNGFLVGLAALAILPQTLLKYRAQALKALRQIRHYALFSYALTPAFSLLFLGIFWAWQAELAPLLAHWAALVAASVGAFILWRATLSKLPPDDPLVRPTIDTGKLLRQSWPFLLTGSLLFLHHWADQLMLRLLCDSHELGIYAAGARIVNLVTIPLLAVNSTVAPRLAAFWAQDDTDNLRRTTRQATWLIFWTSAPVFVLVGVLAEFLLRWFGPEFVEAATAMRILLLGQLCNVLVGPTGVVLNMTRYEKVMNRLALLSLAVNLVAGLALIPFWGATGAAVGSALGLAVLNGLAWWQIRRRMGFSTIKL